MAGRRLSREEDVTLRVLVGKGGRNTQIARLLGVTEGAVRYQRKAVLEEKVDGRSEKAFKAEVLAEVISHWLGTRDQGFCPANIRDLHEFLIFDHGYDGSYKSVLRYVRAKYGRPRIRTYRRVETPAGAQTQTDWGEYPGVVIGGWERDLHAFVMVLSHSRMPAVIWSEREDQLNWQRCHNEAYVRLGGVAAVNRIDNLKTAIAQGAGAWGTVNVSYRSYARSVGFHIDPCGPREANAKGKVESKVKLSRFMLDPRRRQWDSIEEIQGLSDQRIAQWAQRAICPATGSSVRESWERERPFLGALPILPEPFDIAVTRPVRRDCTVSFENRFYCVPFRYVGERVEVRGCAGKVQLLADGQVLREYPRHTAERILVDPTCYEGEATKRVLAPPPLGKMGRKLAELSATPVEKRPIDLYAALAEVAR